MIHFSTYCVKSLNEIEKAPSGHISAEVMLTSTTFIVVSVNRVTTVASDDITSFVITQSDGLRKADLQTPGRRVCGHTMNYLVIRHD